MPFVSQNVSDMTKQKNKKINYIPHKLNENPVVQHVIIRMLFQ